MERTSAFLAARSLDPSRALQKLEEEENCLQSSLNNCGKRNFARAQNYVVDTNWVKNRLKYLEIKIMFNLLKGDKNLSLLKKNCY